MGDVNQILERIESDRAPQGKPNSSRDGRPQQEWTTVQSKAVTVGQREVHVKLSKRGAVFGISFANGEGRPGSASGNATDLKEAREALIAEVNAAFDAVEAEDARFQKSRAERDAKKGGGFSGPVQVRSTGKTERERQKKLGKHKAAD